MKGLYLFPIEKESRDLAKQYHEEICNEIRDSYPLLCKYIEPVDVINISSESRGAQFVRFEPELPCGFQASDLGRKPRNVKDLFTVVTSSLIKHNIKYGPPFKFPI